MKHPEIAQTDETVVNEPNNKPHEPLIDKDLLAAIIIIIATIIVSVAMAIDRIPAAYGAPLLVVFVLVGCSLSGEDQDKDMPEH